MSAFVKQETLIRDEALLVECLKQKGFKEVEVHKEPQPLVGFRGDFRTPDGEGHTKNPDEALKAHIIVRRKHVGSMSNDIGFRKNAEGNYEAFISNYDRNKYNDKWLGELKQEYGVSKAKQIAKQQGLQLLKETSNDGTTVLKYVRA